MATLKATFTQQFPLTITSSHIQELTQYCIQFETKQQHALALNSPYLGLYPCFFLPKDKDDLLSLFDCSDKDISRALRTVPLSSLSRILLSSVRDSLKSVESIDTARKVQSDPFNLFMAYLLYCIHTSPSLSPKEKTQGKYTTLLLLEYKYFTSLVRQRFPYGATEATMKATVDNLSNKFAIRQEGTWKKVLESRATELISPTSIHHTAITTFSDDKAVLYLVTDVQTRIRNQINIVTSDYYLRKDQGDEIASYGLTGNDIDGEKILVDQISTFDAMISNLTNEVLNVHAFIDPALVQVVTSLYPNIRTDLMTVTLTKLSETALTQSKEKKPALALTKTLSRNNLDLYIGIQAYLTATIQKTYRYCIQNRIDITKKLSILKTVKDIYGSSRIADPGILSVKESTAYFIDGCKVTRRAATLASLRIALIVYLILKTFRYLK